MVRFLFVKLCEFTINTKDCGIFKWNSMLVEEIESHGYFFRRFLLSLPLQESSGLRVPDLYL